MRLLSARLIVSLILGVTLVSLLSTYYEVRREKQGLRNELERRAELLGESLVGNVEPSLEKGSLKELKRVVERFSNREHLAGVAVFNAKLEPIAASSGLPQAASLSPSSFRRPSHRTQSRVNLSTERADRYTFMRCPSTTRTKLWVSWSSCTTPAT